MNRSITKMELTQLADGIMEAVANKKRQEALRLIEIALDVLQARKAQPDAC